MLEHTKAPLEQFNEKYHALLEPTATQYQSQGLLEKRFRRKLEDLTSEGTISEPDDSLAFLEDELELLDQLYIKAKFRSSVEAQQKGLKAPKDWDREDMQVVCDFEEPEEQKQRKGKNKGDKVFDDYGQQQTTVPVVQQRYQKKQEQKKAPEPPQKPKQEPKQEQKQEHKQDHKQEQRAFQKKNNQKPYQEHLQAKDYHPKYEKKDQKQGRQVTKVSENGLNTQVQEFKPKEKPQSQMTSQSQSFVPKADTKPKLDSKPFAPPTQPKIESKPFVPQSMPKIEAPPFTPSTQPKVDAKPYVPKSPPVNDNQRAHFQQNPAPLALQHQQNQYQPQQQFQQQQIQQMQQEQYFQDQAYYPEQAYYQDQYYDNGQDFYQEDLNYPSYQKGFRKPQNQKSNMIKKKPAKPEPVILRKDKLEQLEKKEDEFKGRKWVSSQKKEKEETEVLKTVMEKAQEFKPKAALSTAAKEFKPK